MRKRLKMKITTVSEQTIKTPSIVVRAMCPACEREVETLTEQEAARFLEIDEPAMSSLVAAADVHTVQTVSGNLRVCKDSLFTK